MNSLTKRIERLEKSVLHKTKGTAIFLFLSPGETTEQKIVEFEAEHGHFDRERDCIIRFAKEVDNDN
jgi:hypothetical protein